jgi:hypothetical protein
MKCKESLSATGLIIHFVYDFKMFVKGHLVCHLDGNLILLPDSIAFPLVFEEGLLYSFKTHCFVVSALNGSNSKQRGMSPGDIWQHQGTL